MKSKIELKPELIFYSGASLLEGPCWDSEKEVIYCVSIEQSLIYRLETLTSRISSYQTNGHVGCAVVNKNGKVISAEKGGVYSLDPTTGARILMGQFEKNDLMRYNDGKLDPVGRFLVGTKGHLEDYPEKGRLFSYDGKNIRTIISGTTISNGLGFSKQGDKMYFIDTPTKKVARYNYDLEKGDASFERFVVHIEGAGWPDGMCVDVDDMIWVAEWEGGQVCKWNPETGEKLTEIKMPCRRVTSCCLGGKEFDTLFITTAKNSNLQEPMAGGLFKIKIR